MKSMLRISFFAFAILLLSSCTKSVNTPVQQAVNPMVGSWYLYDASETYGNGWYFFDAGIDGVLDFYQNGEAQYEDSYLYMQGNWYTGTSYDEYYDANGDYRTGQHQTFQTQLRNSSNASLSLVFDAVSFSGNSQFTGTYYNGKSVERYIFRRY